MGKNKLKKFDDLNNFSNVIQPKIKELKKDYLHKGFWRRNIFKNNNEICLELGCGKGEYTVELAKRNTGSAALDLAYVASGRFDGFFEENLNIWDIAPGILLIQDAGGVINKADIKKINDIEVITSNPSINEKMVKILDKF